jgi:hypothetical protein
LQGFAHEFVPGRNLSLDRSPGCKFHLRPNERAAGSFVEDDDIAVNEQSVVQLGRQPAEKITAGAEWSYLNYSRDSPMAIEKDEIKATFNGMV